MSSNSLEVDLTRNKVNTNNLSGSDTFDSRLEMI